MNLQDIKIDQCYQVTKNDIVVDVVVKECTVDINGVNSEPVAYINGEVCDNHNTRFTAVVRKGEIEVSHYTNSLKRATISMRRYWKR